MDLEIISIVSNETVPSPEVEQKKMKKGWTLFRSKKSKNIANDQNDEKLPDPVNGNGAEQAEILAINAEIPTEENVKEVSSEENESEVAVPSKRKRFTLKKFFRRSSKKDEKLLPTEENGKKVSAEEGNTKEVPNNECPDENIKEIPTEEPNNEKLPIGDAPSEIQVEKSESPIEDNANEVAVPTKRKRFTLKKFFRRSSKKDEKLPDPVNDEVGKNDAEQVEILPINTELTTEENVKEVSAEENIKQVSAEEGNAKQVPNEEPNNEKLPIGDAPSEIQVEKSELPVGDNANEVAVPEKRKRFTLKMFFRRSSKKDEKLPDPVNEAGENDAKVTANSNAEQAEILPINADLPTKENVKEDSADENVKEVIEEIVKEVITDENVKEVIADENVKEVIAEEGNDEWIVDENFVDPLFDKKVEKSELPVGDNPNVGEVQNADEANNDENMSTDDNAEKSVQLITDAQLKEIEQK